MILTIINVYIIRAVTSAGSSELIAVSSLFTYDIYRTYINPRATGKQILRVSRSAVLGFGCFMGILAVILNKAGVSLGWMYLAMGVLIGSAVIPIAFMLLWSKANAFGAILGSISGCVLGIVTWLSTAKIQYGRVDLDTTGRNAPMLAGNLVAILTGQDSNTFFEEISASFHFSISLEFLLISCWCFLNFCSFFIFFYFWSIILGILRFLGWILVVVD